MRVTPVFQVPPAGAEGYPQLTPELTAAVFARYSRSNEGLQTILGRIDPSNSDKSVDAVFKFVDYGHASIGGMAGGIAFALDGVSMWLAYKLFEIMTMADGQESSTRYISQDISGLVDPAEVGLPAELHGEWRRLAEASFAAYQNATAAWTQFQSDHPEATLIRQDLPEKVKTRLVKNFALDRARYMLLFGLKTNVAIVASARIWTETLRHLSSLPQLEARTLADLIRPKLAIFAPRLIKHSTPESSYQIHSQLDLEESLRELRCDISDRPLPDKCYVQVETGRDNPFWPRSRGEAFAGKVNRYSRLGSILRRASVRVSWNNMTVAELRDLNRHRTGNRQSLLTQRGMYYGPTQQVRTSFSHAMQETVTNQVRAMAKPLMGLQTHFLSQLARVGSPAYVYALLFGSQSPFEHACQVDKFVYEAELRTGMGAHYRYAEHMALAVAHFEAQTGPEFLRGMTLGQAEPE